MENYQLFSILAAAPAILSILYVFWLHRKINIFMRSVSDEITETFLDYAKVLDRVDDIEAAIKVDIKDLVDKKHKKLSTKLNAGKDDLITKSLFIKKSLINLDIPKSQNISPEVLGEFFDEMIKRRWWKKPREED